MKDYVIDAKDMTEKELNRSIKEHSASHDKLIIDNPESRHNICAGLSEDVDIEINGSAGYFVGTMVNGPKIHVIDFGENKAELYHDMNKDETMCVFK